MPPKHPESVRSQRERRRFNDSVHGFRVDYRADSGQYQLVRYTAHGKRVRVGLNAKDVFVACRLAQKLAAQNANTASLGAPTPTLADWWETLKREREGGWTPKTRKGYEECWAHIPGILRDLELKEISSEHVTEFLAGIDKPGTRNHVSRFIAVVLNGAVKAGLIGTSPHAHKNTLKARNPPILSTDQVLLLARTARDLSLKHRNLDRQNIPAAIVLAGICGLRLGEIMALRKSDIDTNNGRVVVSRSRTKDRVAGEQSAYGETKTKRIRVVPIPEICQEPISWATFGLKADDPIFPTYREDVNTRIRNAASKAGVPYVSIHGLRHVALSNLMMTGGLKLAQAIGGHADVSTTANTYGHLTPIFLQKQMEMSTAQTQQVTKADPLEPFSADSLIDAALSNAIFSVKLLEAAIGAVSKPDTHSHRGEKYIQNDESRKP